MPQTFTVGEFREQLKLYHDKDEMIFTLDGHEVGFYRLKERSGLEDPKPGEGICAVELSGIAGE